MMTYEQNVYSSYLRWVADKGTDIYHMSSIESSIEFLEDFYGKEFLYGEGCTEDIFTTCQVLHENYAIDEDDMSNIIVHIDNTHVEEAPCSQCNGTSRVNVCTFQGNTVVTIERECSHCDTGQT